MIRGVQSRRFRVSSVALKGEIIQQRGYCAKQQGMAEILTAKEWKYVGLVPKEE
jgi:hypothetical protein